MFKSWIQVTRYFPYEAPFRPANFGTMQMTAASFRPANFGTMQMTAAWLLKCKIDIWLKRQHLK